MCAHTHTPLAILNRKQRKAVMAPPTGLLTDGPIDEPSVLFRLAWVPKPIVSAAGKQRSVGGVMNWAAKQPLDL